MPSAKVRFISMVQDSQDYSSFQKNEDHMVSKISFDLEVGGKPYGQMQVEVRQPYGTNYESEPLEVAQPTGAYSGSWNQDAFSDLCEQYYRSQVGSIGRGIRIEGAGNVRMRDNKFYAEKVCEFQIPQDGSDAW